MSLREMRQRAGFTQVEVAEKLEVDQSAVSRWEVGDTVPVKKYQRKLAELYGCDEADLLKEKEGG